MFRSIHHQWCSILAQVHLIQHYPEFACEQKTMRFRLRTLMIVLALGPPVIAWLWLHRSTDDPGRVNWSVGVATEDELRDFWQRIEQASGS